MANDTLRFSENIFEIMKEVTITAHSVSVELFFLGRGDGRESEGTFIIRENLKLPKRIVETVIAVIAVIAVPYPELFLPSTLEINERFA